MMRSVTVAVLLLAVVVGTLGCSNVAGVDSPVVGGSCGGPGDCVEDSTCFLSSDFPGGLCSYGCLHSRECPEGSVCVDKKGGVCLLTCGKHEHCREAYKCDDKDLIGNEGKALVCVKD